MVEVLDTDGQDSYDSSSDKWMQDGAGAVLVYSTTSRSSFEGIEKFYNQIQRVKGAASSPNISVVTYGGSVPIMLVGNKCDRTDERVVTVEEGSALASKLDCKFIEASAKNGTNVKEAFNDIVRELQRRSKPNNVTRKKRRAKSPTSGFREIVRGENVPKSMCVIL